MAHAALVMLHGWSDAPSGQTMVAPGWGDSGRFMNEDLGARGGKGVFSKSNWPTICAWEDRLVLVLEFLSRFKVMLACGISWHQRHRGKSGSHMLSPASRWFLCVRIALSAAFCL